MNALTINYNKSQGLLYFRFSGNLSIKEIEAAILEADQKYTLQNRVYILVDIRTARVKFKPTGIYKIFKTVKEFTNKYENVGIAVFSNGTKETAYSFLFKKIASKTNICFETFTSEEEATKWLEYF